MLLLLGRAGQWCKVRHDLTLWTVLLPCTQDIAAYVGVNPRILPLFVAYKDGQKIGEVTGANIPGMESLLWKLERT